MVEFYAISNFWSNITLYVLHYHEEPEKLNEPKKNKHKNKYKNRYKYKNII